MYPHGPTGKGYYPGAPSYPPAYPSYPTGSSGYPHPSGDIKLYIPGGLSPGRMISASLIPGPGRFAINLRHCDGGDIAFHFNPRLTDNVVVRNTCINGGWQHEERHQPYFPFISGQHCTVLILCEPHQFKIAVNNQHFTEYRLRTPGLHMIQFAEINGSFSNGSLQLI